MLPNLLKYEIPLKCYSRILVMDLLAFIVASDICSQIKSYLIHLQNFFPLKTQRWSNSWKLITKRSRVCQAAKKNFLFQSNHDLLVMPFFGWFIAVKLTNIIYTAKFTFWIINSSPFYLMTLGIISLLVRQGVTAISVSFPNRENFQPEN